MKTSLHLSLFICILLLNIELRAQFNLLKEIGNITTFGSPNIETSGLGQIVNGQLNSQKNKFYFKAAKDGYYYTVWQTDGTSQGTVQTINAKGENIHFLNNGIFIETLGEVDDLLFTKWNTSAAIPLPFFNGKKFGVPYDVGSNFIFIGEKPKVYVSNGTNAGSKEIYSFNADYYNKIVTTGDSIAIIYHSAFTPSFEPLIYHSKDDKILPLREYLMPFKTFSAINYAFCYKDVILMQAIENNQQKEFVFNVRTKMISSFPYSRKLISGFSLSNGDYLLLTENNLIQLNPSTLESSIEFSDVYPFSSFHFENDKLIFSGKEDFNTPYLYYSYDGETKNVKILPGTELGIDNYGSKCLVKDNRMYFTKLYGSFFDPTFHLMSYNMTTTEVDSIGSIRENLGAITSEHALFAINDKIVVSRFSESNGHELYTLGTSSLKPVSISNIIVSPTITKEFLTINSESSIVKIEILDSQGKKLYFENQDDRSYKEVNVSSLVSGIYFITILLKNEQIVTKQFIKL